jgi:hypothetical protein
MQGRYEWPDGATGTRNRGSPALMATAFLPELNRLFSFFGDLEN